MPLFNFRQEQALYWLCKAAERGSKEARDQVTDMFHRGYGVNEANFEVVYATSWQGGLSVLQLMGRRLGRKTFRKLELGRGFCSTDQLYRLMKNIHLYIIGISPYSTSLIFCAKGHITWISICRKQISFERFVGIYWILFIGFFIDRFKVQYQLFNSVLGRYPLKYNSTMELFVFQWKDLFKSLCYNPNLSFSSIW